MINRVPCQNNETASDLEGWFFQTKEAPKPIFFLFGIYNSPPTYCGTGTTCTPRDTWGLKSLVLSLTAIASTIPPFSWIF